MAGSATAVSKSWHPFPGGVQHIILGYLNVEPLMPPGRLHVSKVLKRPIMERVSSTGVFIPSDREEILRSGVQFEVFGTVMRGDRRPAPFSGMGAMRNMTCHVYIKVAENTEFCEAWIAEHGSPWPNAHGEAHPLLLPLLQRYDAHMDEWMRNNVEGLRIMWSFSTR